MVKLRFVEPRHGRRPGDVVNYDEKSAAAILDEGAAVLVTEPEPADLEVPSATLADAFAEDSPLVADL